MRVLAAGRLSALPIAAASTLLVVAMPLGEAGGQAFSTKPQVRTWTRPNPSETSAPTRVKRSTRKVKVQYMSTTCDREETHYTVKRKRRAVVITVIATVGYFEGPYQISCGMQHLVAVKVGLKGKLGRRSVQDGSANPPVTRYRAPKT